MQATSAYALDELRVDPWLPGPNEAAVVAQAFTRGEAMLVADLARQMPELAGVCARRWRCFCRSPAATNGWDC